MTRPRVFDGPDVRIVDCDGDGRTELVVATFGDGVRVYDGTTHALEWSSSMTTVSALDVGDVDGDGDMDLVVGDSTGSLSAYDGATKALLFSAPIVSRTIWGVRIADLDRDGNREIVTTSALDASDRYGQVQVHDAATLALLWQSGSLFGQVGDSGTLDVVDVDGDGTLEIIVATYHSLRTFEYYDGTLDSAAPVWQGTVGVVTATPFVGIGCCPAVDVGWQPADDARTPPVRYMVHRGASPLFAPSPSNIVGTTGELSFRDVTVPAGVTSYYVVRAVDGAGNHDMNSVKRAATTAPVPGEVSGSGSPTPLLVEKNRSTTTISFEDRGSTSTYSVYQGTIGSWYSHTGLVCSQSPPPAGGSRRIDVTPESGDRYFLVTAATLCGEGTSGYSSAGVERTPALNDCPP